MIGREEKAENNLFFLCSLIEYIGRKTKNHRNVIIAIIITLTFSFNVFSQNLNGKFCNESDFIEFKNDSVNFKIGSNGGLTIDLCGNGIYKITNDFLLIKTLDFKGLETHIEKIKSKDKLIDFTVLDIENNAILGVNITLTDNKGKFLSGTSTDENGHASIERNKNADKINISLVGYDNYTMEYSDFFDYKLKLVSYVIIENKTVVFKINSMNSSFLNLTLLSTNFKGSTDRKSELVKLEKKSSKYQSRERQLIKE